MISELLYQTAHTHAVWVDLSSMGRLVTSDRDRLDLLHRLSTNHLNKLEPGQGCPTVFTSSIARILDLVVVLNRGETGLLITSPGRAELISNWLKRNVFWNDRFQLENVTGKLRQIGVFGPQSSEILQTWWPEAPALAPYHFVEAADGALLMRVPNPAGYWIMAEQEQIASLIPQLEAQGVLQVSDEAYDVLRIEVGVPSATHELTEDYIPLEIGLWDAVSFNKGCYIGQEIIARMESRGKLANMLVQVTFDQLVAAGTTLLDPDGKKAGTLTSIASLPDGKIIGLAVIKSALVEPGQPLKASGDVAATGMVSAITGNYEPVY